MLLFFQHHIVSCAKEGAACHIIHADEGPMFWKTHPVHFLHQHHSTSHAKEGIDTPPRCPADAEDATITLKEVDAHALACEQLFSFMID